MTLEEMTAQRDALLAARFRACEEIEQGSRSDSGLYMLRF
jgi:hypothetical protein